MHGAAGLVAETNASRTGFEAKATRAEEPLTAPAASPQSAGRRELIIGPHQISSLVITGYRITGYRPGDESAVFLRRSHPEQQRPGSPVRRWLPARHRGLRRERLSRRRGD